MIPLLIPMIPLLLLVLIASIIIGCLPKRTEISPVQYTMHENLEVGRTIGIWIDKRLISERLEIEQAIGTWNYALNGNIKLRVESWDFDMENGSIMTSIRENGWLVMGIEEGNRLIPPVKDGGYRVLGFADMVGGSHLYYVMSPNDKRKVFGTMLHEIGHLLGAGHNGERLMNPYYSPWKYGCIDKGTIEMVGKYRGLDIDKMNWCL